MDDAGAIFQPPLTLIDISRPISPERPARQMLIYLLGRALDATSAQHDDVDATARAPLLRV